MMYKDYVFTAAPGTHTYELHLTLATGSPISRDGLVLIAQSIPFGSTGGAGTLEVDQQNPGAGH